MDLNLQEAIHALTNGKFRKMWKVGDIYCYNQSFFVDKRSKHDIDIYPHHSTVYPIAKNVWGYYYYICPDCGKIHAIHKAAKRQNIPTGCTRKGKRYKVFICPDGSITKYPAHRITLKIKIERN